MPITRPSSKEREIVKRIMAMPEARRARIIEALKHFSSPADEDPAIELLMMLIPPARWQRLLNALLEEMERQRRLDYAESRLRLLCHERGLDWDTMSEQEREDFIDQLIHEDKDVQQASLSAKLDLAFRTWV